MPFLHDRRFILILAILLIRCQEACAQNDGASRDDHFLRRATSAISSQIPRLSRPAADHRPQLGRIYSRAAQFENEHRNPIIVIPGTLGSKLVNKQNGEVVWGSFRLAAARPFQSGLGAKLALPMRPGRRLADLTDHIAASEILSEFNVRVLGVPIEIDAYNDILSTLGVGGYRSETAAALGIVDYGKDHFTCFEFHYDWRRDCSENAALLNRFVQEKAEYVRLEREKRFGTGGDRVRFDIVAHSMGGLIARYFLQYGDQPLPDDDRLPDSTWQGASQVETLILVGTPNAGSMQAMLSLVDGVQYSKLLPRYEAAVLGTMPSAYQLLPRPRHRAVLDEKSGKCVDLYDWRVWQQNRWGLLNPDQDDVLEQLIPNSNARSRRDVAEDHLKKCLWQAYQFHRALDTPSTCPEGTKIFLIAGDSELTDAKANANPKTHSIDVIEQAPGDATVLRSSAMMDERLSLQAPWTPQLQSPIDWAGCTFIFTDHLGITSQPAFADNALYLLLERPR